MRFDDLTEQPVTDGSTEIVKAFVDFASQRLGLDKQPKIKLIRDPKAASVRRSFGGYMPGEFSIEINTGNRHIMDVLRTLAHEMVHYKQDLNDELKPDSGRDGSPQENEANAKAAVIMRLWAKMNPELFQHAALLAESWSKKYKGSINCSNPKGFSQRAHCQGRNKSEDYVSEAPKQNDPAVRQIQHMLNKKFNANLDVDGYLGPLTKQSILKFLPKAKTGPAPKPKDPTAVQSDENL